MKTVMLQTITILILLVFGCSNSNGESDFFELGSNKIRMVPAIVHGENVYIQALAKNDKKEPIYLIGVDGKSYLLTVKNHELKRYTNIDWGFGYNEAIQLSAKNNLPQGYLVAFGQEIPKLLEWKTAIEIDRTEANANRHADSNKFISDDGTYGKSAERIYKSPAIQGTIILSRYRKLVYPPDFIDDEFFKETIEIIDKNNNVDHVITSYDPCEGPARSYEKHHPIGLPRAGSWIPAGW